MARAEPGAAVLFLYAALRKGAAGWGRQTGTPRREAGGAGEAQCFR